MTSLERVLQADDADWADLDLPHGPEAGPQARHALRTAFEETLAELVGAAGATDDAGLPDDCAVGLDAAQDLLQDVLIVAGELVLNAVDHGRPGMLGTVRLSWRWEDGRVYLRVLDAGYDPEFADGPPGLGAPESIRGRGLFMVDAICEEWSVETDPITETTQVTACLGIAQAS